MARRSSVLGLTLGFLVATCGQPSLRTDGDRTIEIEMRDFAFTPEALSLTAGQRVTLVFKNVGNVEHEFMAGTEVAYGRGYVKDWLADAHLDMSDHDMDHAGVGIRVAPHTTRTLTFVVPSHGGVFEFGCLIIGHYESGMHGRLVVDVPASPSGDRVPVEGRQDGPSAGPTHAPMGDDDGEGH